MTMQMMDNFIYRGKRAEAIAISRRFTFTPAYNFGINTVAWSTENYRGFRCDYVLDELFTVRNIYLFSKNRNYPVINGQNPKEIPEFIKTFESINISSKEKKKYIDVFPMQYKNIDYVYEYTGKILLGIEPSANKLGQDRYQKVYELEYKNGLLDSQVDITKQWKDVCLKESGEPEEYWWESESTNYFHLINYTFMGIE